MSKINQAENFAADFGFCLRSSAIFWIPPSGVANLSVVLSNYWKFKNNINVLLVASFRSTSGNQFSEKIDFGESDVLISIR